MEVVKEMVADPSGPTALLIVSVGNFTQFVHEPDCVLGPMAGASRPFDNAGSAVEDILKPNGVAA